MSTAPISVAALAALLLASCAAASLPKMAPLRTLAKGIFGGIQEPKQELVKDKSSWEKLWVRHSAPGQPPEPLPPVDFKKELVVAVSLGRKSSGGWQVEISKAEIINGKLRIHIVETAPRPGGMSITALTAPFHFAAIPKTDLPPEFIPVRPPATRQ